MYVQQNSFKISQERRQSCSISCYYLITITFFKQHKVSDGDRQYQLYIPDMSCLNPSRHLKYSHDRGCSI